MNNIESYIFIISVLGMILLLIIKKDSLGIRSFLVVVGALIIYAVAIYSTFSFFQSYKITTKGEKSLEYARISLLFLSMLLGMVANYFYQQTEQRAKEQSGKNYASLIAPILVSPIVFIPVYSAFKEIAFSSDESAKLMIFLISFENGFFWKMFLDKKYK